MNLLIRSKNLRMTRRRLAGNPEPIHPGKLPPAALPRH